MNKYLIIIVFIILPFSVNASSLGEKLSGKILLNVEKNGEAWYINPSGKDRYFLGRPSDAFEIMRKLGLGINELDFQKIAAANMPVAGDLDLAKKLSGRIVLQVEKNGEAWYINPDDLKKYYLGRPDDAFKIMRELSLGISREDLAKIHKPGIEESINNYSKYEHKKVSVKGEIFSIDIVEIDLANPNLEILTPTSVDYPRPEKDKNSVHGANSLAKFILDNNAFAGINGTYFCSSSGCGTNYYFYPVYDANKGIMVNDTELKYWTTGPIMAFDVNNNFYYFKDSREFKSVSEFEKTYQVKLKAAIGNKPRLVEKYMNTLIEWDIDDKQKNTKALRNAIGYENNKIYLVVASNATVIDLAEIMKVIGTEYALNLDGGYSSTLWYNDEYMVSPGRDIPNAIIFKEKIK